jgi:3-methyladenine DNA glycosylase AlkC
MATHRKTEKQFSLKDLLFNEAKVKQLASELKAVHPPFAATTFVREVVLAFPEQELMERIMGIRDALRRHLPAEYKDAVAVILKALPEALDNTKTDDDFGSFIHAPYSYFVAEYGCTKKHLSVSLKALEEITKRFSAEASLRSFINVFPEETYVAVTKWAKSPEYHVRRLASEGTRPALPWASKIKYNSAVMLPLLDRLHADRTRYVTRSVANHLNDVSKFAPGEVLARLELWNGLGKQNPSELKFISSHSLRTLVKSGDARALKLFGYTKAKVESKLELARSKVKVGDQVEFKITLTNQEKSSANLLVHYVIYFKKANGSLSPKVFLAKKLKLNAGESVVIKKSHSLKPMTTRVLHTGEHILEVRVNGQKVAAEKFLLE